MSKEVLLYHVLNGAILTTDFSERAYETVSGQTIRWDIENRHKRRRLKSDSSDSSDSGDSNGGGGDHDGDGGFTDGFHVEGYGVIDATGNRTEVIVGNVRAGNGVVHLVEDVLLPSI